MRISQWVTTGISILMLVGCGAGGVGSLAEGGISGTGISVGPITGFGSVYVNGVKYDVSRAAFIRGGQSVGGQEEFSIGEYVTVTGDVNADGVSGTASKVTFENSVEGPVTAVSTDGVSCEILGQKVRTDRLTVLIGFQSLTALAAGNVVEVSGSRNAAGEITATSVKFKQAAFVPGAGELEVKGPITSVDATGRSFTLNGLLVDYGGAILRGFPASGLAAGQFVVAKSRQSLAGNVMRAESVELKSALPAFTANTKVEFEGVITRFASSADFDADGLRVLASAQTEFKDGTHAALAPNVRVKVEGVIDASGILAAREVEVRESRASIELKARIEAINAGANELTLLGKTVVIDSSTILLDDSAARISPLTLARFAVGDLIEVKGNLLSNGKVLATRIDREAISGSSSSTSDDDAGTEAELEGIVSAVDTANFTFTLLGVTVTTSPTSSLLGADEKPMNQGAFFAQLVPGSTKVEVKGDRAGVSHLAATKVEIED